ncbi:MAG: DUF3488 domain-containing protein [Planctomyces sp.]|nr:DUF3488 domain-containing protein [Planctomyces sp.]
MGHLHSILTFSVTLLAMLSGVIFATAEGQPLAVISIPVGVLTWRLCDGPRRLQPPWWALNLAGLLAIFAAAAELLSGSIEARLLSGGHLLVYLTWVFLAQPKRRRVIWWLLALSLLQVAVASVLTSAPWFGLALFGWMLAALWTLAVFTAQSAVARTRRSLPLDEDQRSMLDQPPLPQMAGTYALPGLRLDDRFRLISVRFATNVTAMTAAGLLTAMLFFLLVPRVWMSRMRFFDDSRLAAIRTSGFADQVRLGDIGELMASNEVALEARFQEHPSQRAWPGDRTEAWLGESPLFRARTLEYYRRGRWDSFSVRGIRTTQYHPPRRPLVRINISLKSVGTRTLFSVGHPVACVSQTPNTTIERRTATNEYIRTDEANFDSFEYTLYADPTPAAIVGAPESPTRIQSLPGVNERAYSPGLIQLPENLKSIGPLTREALRGLPPDASELARAQRIETFLRDGDRFTYTARLTVADPSIDPLDDFLLNRRSGHCEYFATALALMLREAGIPSRLVTGFKGGYWDSAGNRYIVLQRHAHAWVEALLDDGWITLDATPAIRDAEVNRADRSGRNIFQSVGELMQSMWRQGISMNSPQQSAVIYGPLLELGKDLWERIRDIRGTSARIASFVWNVLRNPQQWISWRGGLTVFLLLSGLALFARVVMSVLRRLRSWRRREQSADGPQHVVEFYQRFRDILARAGLSPERSQTAAEFGAAVDDWLETRGPGELPPALAAELTRDFYRVRFGGVALTPEEERRLESQLSKLDDCLSQPTRVNSNGHDLRSR